MMRLWQALRAVCHQTLQEAGEALRCWVVQDGSLPGAGPRLQRD